VSGRVVVVAGAPGAGGPVFVRALREAGVFVESWRARTPDVEGSAARRAVVALNDRALAGVNLLDPEGLRNVAGPWEAVDEARARASSVEGAWAWQDPRTTLFLDFWNEVVPEAFWVFPVRDPAIHVWAFLRRYYNDPRWSSPLERARSGLRLWRHYNELVLRFVERAPDRSLVVAMPECVEDGGLAVERELCARLGVQLPTGYLGRGYAPHLFTKRAPRWVRLLAALDPEVRRIEAGLRRQRRGEGPSRPLVGTAPSGNGRERVVCVVAPARGAYSETFIEAHVRRLPARVKVLYVNGRDLSLEDGSRVTGVVGRAGLAVRREFGVTTTPAYARVVGRYLRREGVEAVLAEYSTNALRVRQACERAGIPLVVHFHGFDAYARDRFELHRAEFEALFRTAAAFVVVSREMARQVASLGAPPERIVVNPCGVDVEQFAGANPGASTPMFLAVGRFVEKKGPHLTLLAFAKALEEAPDARLVMIGDGTLLAPCKQMARGLGLGDRVTFPGVVDHAGVALLMKSCRAFVQHSQKATDGNSEGTPVAVLEAGASGVPVIGARHAGIADAVVHGETGLLVAEGDVDGMARHIVELARSPELAARLGVAARERIAREYSMERSLARLWRVVEDAIEAGSTPSVEEAFVRRATERA
jgi:colanic acid/amylovoran biosynthesis glycosyltransferase